MYSAAGEIATCLVVLVKGAWMGEEYENSVGGSMGLVGIVLD